MNLLEEFDTLEGTEYVNAPAMLPTSQGVTPRNEVVMCDQSSTPNPNSSIQYPSAPWAFVERVRRDPPDTFKLLPVVELSDGFMYTPIDKDAMLAPAIPLVEKLRRGYIVAWTVIRCPYCGGSHQHNGTDGGHRTKDAGIPEALSNLGGRLSHCDTDLSGSWRGDEYRLIGLTNAPNRRELDKYFPLHPGAVRKEQDFGNWAVGGCYLVKSGPHYKIGVSTNPNNRIKSLQTGSPYPIETVHIEFTNDFQQLETELHSRFAEYRTQGEWFAFPESMVSDVIAAMKGGAV